MKKTVKILAVVMVIVMLSLTVVGCSKMIHGKYVANIGGLVTSYEFSGLNKVTRVVGIGDLSSTDEGTYEIVKSTEDEDKLVIKFTFGDDTETYSYSEGKEDGTKYIKIDGWKFEKE